MACCADTMANQGGGGVLGNRIPWGVLENPHPFLKMVCGGFLTGGFRRKHTISANFFGDILLGCTSKVVSFSPMQPLWILSPLLGTPENAGVTYQFRPLVGPREGRGEVATFDFIPSGDP